MTETSQLSTKQRVVAARKRYEELLKQKEGSFPLHIVAEPKLNGETDATDLVTQLKQENHDLKEQAKELNLTVEQQKVTIKKLRSEAAELKLDRMDLEDRITELEEQVSQLKAHPHGQFHSESQEKLSVVTEDKSETIVDFKEKLMSWKGWQPDMRAWNTATKAQI